MWRARRSRLEMASRKRSSYADNVSVAVDVRAGFVLCSVTFCSLSFQSVSPVSLSPLPGVSSLKIT